MYCAQAIGIYPRSIFFDRPTRSSYILQWLTEQIWPTEGRLMSPEFVRAGSRMAVAECIKAGVTCINDMYFYPGEFCKQTLLYQTAWG